MVCCSAFHESSLRPVIIAHHHIPSSIIFIIFHHYCKYRSSSPIHDIRLSPCPRHSLRYDAGQGVGFLPRASVTVIETGMHRSLWNHLIISTRLFQKIVCRSESCRHSRLKPQHRSAHSSARSHHHLPIAYDPLFQTAGGRGGGGGRAGCWVIADPAYRRLRSHIVSQTQT